MTLTTMTSSYACETWKHELRHLVNEYRKLLKSKSATDLEGGQTRLRPLLINCQIRSDTALTERKKSIVDRTSLLTPTPQTKSRVESRPISTR